MRYFLSFCLAALVVPLVACTGQISSPHPAGAGEQNTLFTAFTGRDPKTLDPTSSYASDETPFTYQVYEPPLSYHYLKRPYTLVPGSLEALPELRWLDAKGKPVASAQLAVTSEYTFKVKRGVQFAPHPAFAKNKQNQYLYHALKADDLKDKYSPWDFAVQGSRELKAHDFVYSIKRLATPRVTSPVFGHLSEYIVGLKPLAEQLKAKDKAIRAAVPKTARDFEFLDLRQYELPDAQIVDDYTFKLSIAGAYPQFKYWLAMTFFAPLPWEADAFYSQQGMAERNLSLARWPVGTGPYMLESSTSNRQHVLKRNPNYRGGVYPCEGEPQDQALGLLNDCGKTTPFIDRIVFNLEREIVPLEAKFFAGYYDLPEAQRGEFGSAYLVSIQDGTEKGKVLQQRGIRLPSHVDTSIHYLGFNWRDPVVGQGLDAAGAARNRALRQAIAIAYDYEEYVALYEADQAQVAMGPVPPGLFGYREGPEGLNTQVYDWVDGKPVRKSIEIAKKRMVEAGYPDGRDVKTGQPLVLYMDVMGSGQATKAQYEWEQRQFAKLGIQLEIRSTDYNRFQEKMRKGQVQLFSWGWSADYPDAENFLFLLNGANAKADNDGENASNYKNPQFDALFAQMKTLDDGPQKQVLVDGMMRIVLQDVPWLWGTFPKSAGAYHQWVHNGKPTQMIRNHLQYLRIDAGKRVDFQAQWNRPKWAWLLVGLGFLALLLFVIRRAWKRYQASTARQGG